MSSQLDYWYMQYSPCCSPKITMYNLFDKREELSFFRVEESTRTYYDNFGIYVRSDDILSNDNCYRLTIMLCRVYALLVNLMKEYKIHFIGYANTDLEIYTQMMINAGNNVSSLIHGPNPSLLDVYTASLLKIDGRAPIRPSIIPYDKTWITISKTLWPKHPVNDKTTVKITDARDCFMYLNDIDGEIRHRWWCLINEFYSHVAANHPMYIMDKILGGVFWYDLPPVIKHGLCVNNYTKGEPLTEKRPIVIAVPESVNMVNLSTTRILDRETDSWHFNHVERKLYVETTNIKFIAYSLMQDENDDESTIPNE